MTTGNKRFKKILLISCPDEIWGVDTLVTFPNLGLERLAGAVKDFAEVRLLDLKLTKRKVRDVLKDVLHDFMPDLVGISCMTFQYATGLKMASFIKSLYPGIKIVFGGYHPTLCVDDVLKEKAVDYVVGGEGEFTFMELAKGMELRRIAGLSYKNNGRIVHNSPRPLAKNLDSLPMPYREARMLKKGYNVVGEPAETIETSRGCVNNCKFCSIRQFYGSSFREFGIGRVIEEIKLAKAFSNTKWIFIVDDNITLDMDRLGRLCDAIVENGLDGIKYAVQASSVGIGSRRDIVEKMSAAGFEAVFLGIENTGKETLLQLGKGDIVDCSKLAIKNLRDFGIIVLGGFIVGMPEDDKRSILENAKFSLTHGVDFPIFFISTPYPKTEWRKELDGMGLITNKTDFSKYTSSFANVKTRHLDSDELWSATFRAYKKFYYRFWLRQLSGSHALRWMKYWFYGLKWSSLFIRLKLMSKIFGRKKVLDVLSKNNVNF